MQQQSYKNQLRIDWSRFRDRLVYLPGAAILTYGFWLTLAA